MPERPRPDLNRVRDALRDRDDAVPEEEPREDAEEAPEAPEAPEEDDGDT